MPNKTRNDPVIAKSNEVRQMVRLFQNHPFRLRDYHAVGAQLDALAKRIPVGSAKGWREEVAKAVGKSEETLNKCFQLYRTCDSKNVAAFEKMGVGWGLLLIAIGITDAAVRHRLLRRAMKEGWSCHDLQREIQRRKGTRRGGGRPRRQLTSHGMLPDVHELLRLTTNWSEFATNVIEAHHDEYRQELKHLADEHQITLAKVLATAVANIKAQKNQCQRAIEALRGFQAALHDA